MSLLLPRRMNREGSRPPCEMTASLPGGRSLGVRAPRKDGLVRRGSRLHDLAAVVDSRGSSWAAPAGTLSACLQQRRRGSGTPRTFSASSGRRVEAVDLPRLCFHGPRHSDVPRLLRRGVRAQVVSERAGNSAVCITLDTQSQVLPRLQEGAVFMNGAATRKRPGASPRRSERRSRSPSGAVLSRRPPLSRPATVPPPSPATTMLKHALAERHGSRTHPGQDHCPADGFEDRGSHRTTSRSAEVHLVTARRRGHAGPGPRRRARRSRPCRAGTILLMSALGER